MVENLEDSKRALAKSEKESAWREMAKQVAHEIKNPLTPMKLTLQQMEQALRSGNLSIDKSQKSVDVLLKQDFKPISTAPIDIAACEVLKSIIY